MKYEFDIVQGPELTERREKVPLGSTRQVGETVWTLQLSEYWQKSKDPRIASRQEWRAPGCSIPVSLNTTFFNYPYAGAGTVSVKTFEAACRSAILAHNRQAKRAKELLKLYPDILPVPEI